MRAAQLRKAKGLTQDDLASMIGVEQPTISRFERGEDGITLRLIKDIAGALNVSVADLFAEDRSEQEQRLLSAFRSLPAERQQGWLDLAETFAQARPQ